MWISDLIFMQSYSINYTCTIYTEPQKKRYKEVYCIILQDAITLPFCIL